MPVTYHCADCDESSERQDTNKLPKGWTMDDREKTIVVKQPRGKRSIEKRVRALVHQCPTCATKRAEKIRANQSRRVKSALKRDAKRKACSDE